MNKKRGPSRNDHLVETPIPLASSSRARALHLEVLWQIMLRFSVEV